VTERVCAYIDGLNVYQGIVDRARRDLLWLDYMALIRQFLQPEQTLEGVYYFTAHRRTPPESYARQQRYFEALDAKGGVTRVEGHFEKRKLPCVHCGRLTEVPRERATDVQLAASLVHGAASNEYDVAVLVSGDSDYLLPIKHVQLLGKKVKLLRPVGRRSDQLADACDFIRDVRIAHLSAAKLSDPLPRTKGKPLECPFSWLDLGGKQARLNDGHRAQIAAARQVLPATHHNHLHGLADQMWTIEGRAVGHNAIVSW
jgi:uncharacterized LabA/DUF88 family protein